MRPLLVVDAANVVGSVPDGWWRDRHGATERLRDRLASIATDGLLDLDHAPEELWLPPIDVILVVEGQAKRVASIPNVEVLAARGSGDDAVVELVRARGERWCAVATADRELMARVRALGAEVVGPRTVRQDRSAR